MLNRSFNPRITSLVLLAFQTIMLWAKISMPLLAPVHLARLEELSQRLEVLISTDCSAFINVTSLLYVYVVDVVRGVKPSGKAFPPKFIHPVTYEPYLLEGILKSIRALEGTPVFRMYIRCLLSFFACRRILKGSPTFDPSTIVTPSPVTKVPTMPVGDISARLGVTRDMFRGSLFDFQRRFTYHLTNSKGPNGHALWTSHVDAFAVMRDVSLSTIISSFASVQGLSDVFVSLTECAKIPPFSKPDLSEPLHSKLTIIPDKAGKSRIVAQVDYWTQALLQPLQSVLKEVLSRIPMDGTYNQEAAAMLAKSFTKEGLPTFSVDLTSATDRFPVWLQREVLGYLSRSAEFADLWKSIMVDRAFTGPDGTEVRYAVGQPMGILSSFAMFALTHHFVVQWAAIRAGHKSVFNQYVIIGDDLVIASKDVYNEYIKLIGELGVEFSPMKSFIHSDHSLSTAELAKRLFINGLEYTSLPVTLLSQCVTDSLLFPMLQNELWRRDFMVSQSDFWTFIAGLGNKEGFINLSYLNGVPSVVSGIVNPIPSEGEHFSCENWASDYSLTRDDIKNAYIYSQVNSVLTRVDQMVNTSLSISDVILTAARIQKSNYVINESKVAMTIEDLLSTNLLESHLTSHHPVVKAVNSEHEKLASILSRFVPTDEISFEETNVYLLDLLRSSMADTLPSEKHREAKIRNSLFSKLQSALVDAVSADSLSATFTIRISSMSRVWTSYFKLGQAFLLSSAKPKVSSYMGYASSMKDSWTKELATPLVAKLSRIRKS